MQNTKKGFTLIELLIVITIIGILAAALLPNILGAPAKARDAARLADLNNIAAAVEVYNADNGSYPADSATNRCIGAGGVLDATFPGSQVPEDPSGSVVGGCAAGQYLYCELDGTAGSYALVAAVEDNTLGNADLGDIVAGDCAGTSDPSALIDASAADFDAYVVVK